MLFIQSVLTVQQNQSELGPMPMEYLKVALNWELHHEPVDKDM